MTCLQLGEVEKIWLLRWGYFWFSFVVHKTLSDLFHCCLYSTNVMRRKLQNFPIFGFGGLMKCFWILLIQQGFAMSCYSAVNKILFLFYFGFRGARTLIKDWGGLTALERAMELGSITDDELFILLSENEWAKFQCPSVTVFIWLVCKCKPCKLLYT